MAATTDVNGGDNLHSQTKIKLYTNHGCGWSHRVSIVLKELGLDHEEVHIDMDVARPDWFLKLNPVCFVILKHLPIEVMFRAPPVCSRRKQNDD
jgi:hypothetical protein